MNKIVSILSYYFLGPYMRSSLLKEVRGKENFPKRNFIMASNHLSHLDWFIDGWLLTPRRFTFIAQIDKMTGTKSLFRDLLYLYAGVVRVDRNDKESKRQALVGAIEMLKKGYCLILYPEGTRARDGQTHDFKAGVGKIHIETGAPVVPSAIKGSYEMMPPGEKMKGKKMVSVLIGKQLDFPEERAAAAKLDKSSAEYREICSKVAAKVEDAVRDLLKDGVS